MTAPNRTLYYLELIADLIEKIQRRLTRVREAEFVEDCDEIDLLAFRLSQIGEYCDRIDDNIKARHPAIPWPQIMGMRNLIVHEYLRVVPVRLWETAQSDLAPILAMCRTEIDRLD